jgi:hypothetical protein
LRARLDWRATAIFLEAVEEGRRREPIDGRVGTRMVLSEIAEHVGEGVTCRARRGQSASVPAVRPEPASAKDERIHAPGDAHGQARHPEGKSPFVAGFDEQMEVIRLHREVNDPKDPMMALIR